MDKKYQVFISSTIIDLKRERQKVCDAVLALYQIPIGIGYRCMFTQLLSEIAKEQAYCLIVYARRKKSVIITETRILSGRT